jgi:hypothetical protein
MGRDKLTLSYFFHQGIISEDKKHQINSNKGYFNNPFAILIEINNIILTPSLIN